MSGRPSVWTRTGRLEATLEQVNLRREVAGQEVAVREAVDREELLAEAQALLQRARAMGARTDAEVAAFAGPELGMTPEDLRAEMAHMGGGR